MKKILLIALACILCFFIGYYSGSKSKPVNKRFNTPYRMQSMPKRILTHNKLPNKISRNIPTGNKLSKNMSNVSSTISKTKSNMTATNKKSK